MVGFCRDMCRALGSGALIILATSPQDPGKSTCTTTLIIIDSQTYFELILAVGIVQYITRCSYQYFSSTCSLALPCHFIDLDL